ncbi:ORF-76 [Catopsilia pomona nucleopolyhedrovirus]|uniref:ORF-76 n=1 Tax=Catopsilia pomona nucleopolyhedrovirus TaxID=1850906 RepID=A0A172WZF1_9ABAC|nr:ORF-76 [Catopsilia pomona nucleopolyhedrovirus]ANF29724.1 ORF-76 [Catopsilia pomona nucleopolyhedrovirus]
MCAEPSVILNRNDVYKEIYYGRQTPIMEIYFNHHLIILNCLKCDRVPLHMKHVVVNNYSDLFDLFVELYYGKNLFCQHCNSVPVFLRNPQECCWQYFNGKYLTNCHELNNNLQKRINIINGDGDGNDYDDNDSGID